MGKSNAGKSFWVLLIVKMANILCGMPFAFIDVEEWEEDGIVFIAGGKTSLTIHEYNAQMARPWSTWNYHGFEAYYMDEESQLAQDEYYKARRKLKCAVVLFDRKYKNGLPRWVREAAGMRK